ncbi:MAG TPA: hypothetical protein DCZ92_03865 [Elusimicrobia bacterium]|nr:MAG: hypothetical protein A2016_01240 [Elusimicrobia bacterium GWF2_62_30]HBA59953.1 hypothetical protein [Elusimicrobiota bacterium]
MKATPANQKLFWDGRARNYPLPFERSTLSKTRRILRLLGKMGAEFRGRDILDIGCGTGVYALALARGAGKVTGVDSSPAMLRVFRAQQKASGIKNARCLAAAWGKLPAARVKGKFDIALASMTMAIKDRADVLKMEAAAWERCVYIGWAGVRRNPLLEKVYSGHGLKYRAPEGAGPVLKILKELGRTPRVKFITDSWTKSAAPAETLRDIALNMKVNGAVLKEAWVSELLRKRTRGGKVKQRTTVRKALITWSPPGPGKRPVP